MLHTPEGLPYLKTHALTNIAWNEETRALYEKNSASGFQFFNPRTLFGEVLSKGSPVISNDPASDPRRGGIPEGHPPLRAFMGIPFKRGGSLVGMVGIANRPGGYEEDLIDDLDVFLKTCTNIICSLRNETRRKEAEDALRLGEEHYRGLFEACPVSLWEEDFSAIKTEFDAMRNKRGVDFTSYFMNNPEEAFRYASMVKINDVNAATLKLFKASSKEEMLEGLPSVLTSNSLNTLIRALVLLAGGGTTFEDECINRTLEGEELRLYIKWMIVPGHEKDWSKVIVSLSDLTDLRRAEDYVKNILETVEEGYVVIDRGFNIVSANRAFMSQIGKKDVEVIGRKCHEVSHGKTRPCFEDGEECPVKKTFETGKSHSASHIHNASDGKKIFTEIKSYPLKDLQGGVGSAIETVIDITEKKRLEAEVLRAQKLDSIGLLAGGIAHDFNNLLMGIFGYLSLLKLRTDSAGLPYFQEAEKALERAKALTQQLLTFSKGGEPIKKPSNLVPLLRHSVTFALSGSNATCEFSSESDPIYADIDEGQIGQVAHNIVVNSVEAMPQGGAISVRLERASLADGASLLKGGRYVKIIIKDTGMGILKEHLPRIFDPYFTTKKRGSGLGLATSYSIIKRHGGTIEVISKIGAGTAFTIYLPESAPDETTERPSDTGMIFGHGKILVMEDDPVVANVCRELLIALGYSAETVAHGEEAADKYISAMDSGSPFDAVILDLTIKGGLGGKETIRRLLAVDPGIRAIVSSGYAADPIMANFRQYGFSAILIKPYQIKEMGRTIHDVLKREG